VDRLHPTYHAFMSTQPRRSVAGSTQHQPDTDLVAVVPIKSFTQAKGRLRPALSADDRERLAVATATGVLEALQGVPTVVVCDDETVADLAAHCGCEPMMTMTRGLNAVVAEAMEHLHHRGVARVMVAHADLPRPEALATIATSHQLAIVPDHRLDGTNVLILPSDEARCVSYGPGSFRRHLGALTSLARDRGLRLDVIRDHQLGLDLDHPSDLSHPVTSTSRHQGASHDH